MKSTMKRFAILLVIFIAAIAVYFIWSKRKNENTGIIYSAAEKTTLPVIYPETLGRRMNVMLGYRQEMGYAAAGDSLTILPRDRQLPLYIEHTGSQVVAARFEIRSLDLERLVERTELETWEPQEEATTVVLPIQNLLAADTQYLMLIELDTELYGTVFYYTRIMLADETIPKSMVDLAADFSSKTFDYDQARELVTYLESSETEDNSSLGSVSIRSGFSQLTWGGLMMKPVTEPAVILKESDGIMAMVQLKYMTERETEAGERELYEVEENFTMKWNEIRTYMMDYSRSINQIFTGSRLAFSGKRIMLGITNDSQIAAGSSENGQFYTFVSGRELWSFEQGTDGGKAVKVFSFRGDDEQDVRSNYDQHTVKILSVDDSGDIVFLVYGYMNRGVNEGKTGVAAYRYDNSESAVDELFFAPVPKSFAYIKGEVEQLTYLSDENMLYCFIDRAVYGVDINSKEHMIVADGLTDGSYAVSADGSQLAWQEGTGPEDAGFIHWMDLSSGNKTELQSADGEILCTLGFVGRDLVYGIAGAADQWIANGRVRDVPLTAIEIRGDGQQVESRYEKEGYYLADVVVSDSRIHLGRYVRQGTAEFVFADEDTIVCNEEIEDDALSGIGWYASQDRGKLYFAELDNEIRENAVIMMTTPKHVSYAESEQLVLISQPVNMQPVFYAYGGGHYLGSSREFADAVKLAYDRMGIVVDTYHRVLWNRVNRSNQHTIRDTVQTSGMLARHLEDFESGVTYPDGVTMIDARGCSLNQILYFIDQDYPVAVYEGNGSYRLLSGFDQYNITVTDPETGAAERLGLNDGAEYFRLKGNDFVCGVMVAE